MKAINKIWVLAALLPFVLFSCKKAELTYEPGEPDLANCYGVYFPTQEASGSHTFDPEMDRIITVTVARKADQPLINEEIKVPYTVKSSEENIFQIGEIVFASGQSETTIDITFDKAEEGVKYDLSLQLEDPQYASLYASNPTELKLDVMVVAWQYILNPQTKEKAVFTFTQEYWGETCWAYVKYYDLDGVWTCQTESFLHENKGEQYGPDTGGYGFWGNAEAEGEGELQFKIYSKELNADGNMYMELIPSVIYHHSTYDADVVLYDWYYYFTVYNPQAALQGVSWINFAKNYSSNYPLGYYDNNGGLFFFAHGRYMMDIGGWTMDSYDVIGIGEGFIRTDYSLSLEADYPSNGATPVYVTAGRDVKTLQYAIYPGKLSENEAEKKAEAIAAKEEESESFSEFEYDETKDINYATLSVSPETSGQYTIVAVALDEKKAAQNSAHTVFNFVAADDQADHAVQLEVGTEDVPARYGDYPTNSSFAFYVMGKNIQEAHINIYATETFKENQEAILAEMKAAETGSGVSVASASVLAEINAPGGFYTYTTGLKALTSYTVVVWATNGEMETWQTAEYTTEGLPNEYLCTGTYTYKAWWNGSDNKQELYKNPNIADTYVLPNWGGGVDFVFTMDEEGIITIPTFAIGATHSSYGTVYYVDPFNYWSEAGLAADETRAVHSYFDAESNTYNFHFVLAVSAGSFGHFWETYTPNAEESQANILNNVIAKALASNTLMAEKDTKFTLPSLELKSLPRDAQPVKAKVNVSYERKEKVGKDDSKALESLRVSFN